MDEQAARDEILKIIEIICKQGTDALINTEHTRLLIMCAMFNMVLEQIERHGNCESVDSILEMFSQMCDMVKTRIADREESLQLEKAKEVTNDDLG